MDIVPLTRPFLESLTTVDLIKWADQYGVDIPTGLDRIFIIEELLDIAAPEAEQEPEMQEDQIEQVKSKFPESAALPKQYNITFLETLVRDPLWAFVFWEIKSADRDLHEKAVDFNGYFLKVSPWGRTAPNEAFTVPLSPEDIAWYLGFPPAEENDDQDRYYTVELFADRGGEEFLLAATQPFRLPALRPRVEKPGFEKSRVEKKEHNGQCKQTLIQLSGIDDVHILRNGDRQLRVKTYGNSAAF